MRGEGIGRYITIKDKAVGLIPGMRWALGSSVTTTIRTATTSVGGSANDTATASCNAGEIMLGGGCKHAANIGQLDTYEGYPDSATSFRCSMRNTTGGSVDIVAYAVCLG